MLTSNVVTHDYIGCPVHVHSVGSSAIVCSRLSDQYSVLCRHTDQRIQLHTEPRVGSGVRDKEGIELASIHGAELWLRMLEPNLLILYTAIRGITR